MTILRDATAINDGTTAIMAVSLRNHGDNGGATAVYAVQAPQWYRASGVTGVLPTALTPSSLPHSHPAEYHPIFGNAGIVFYTRRLNLY